MKKKKNQKEDLQHKNMTLVFHIDSVALGGVFKVYQLSDGAIELYLDNVKIDEQPFYAYMISVAFKEEYFIKQKMNDLKEYSYLSAPFSVINSSNNKDNVIGKKNNLLVYMGIQGKMYGLTHKLQDISVQKKLKNMVSLEDVRSLYMQSMQLCKGQLNEVQTLLTLAQHFMRICLRFTCEKDKIEDEVQRVTEIAKMAVNDYFDAVALFGAEGTKYKTTLENLMSGNFFNLTFPNNENKKIGFVWMQKSVHKTYFNVMLDSVRELVPMVEFNNLKSYLNLDYTEYVSIMLEYFKHKLGVLQISNMSDKAKQEEKQKLGYIESYMNLCWGISSSVEFIIDFSKFKDIMAEKKFDISKDMSKLKLPFNMAITMYESDMKKYFPLHISVIEAPFTVKKELADGTVADYSALNIDVGVVLKDSVQSKYYVSNIVSYTIVLSKEPMVYVSKHVSNCCTDCRYYKERKIGTSQGDYVGCKYRSCRKDCLLANSIVPIESVLGVIVYVLDAFNKRNYKKKGIGVEESLDNILIGPKADMVVRKASNKYEGITNKNKSDLDFVTIRQFSELESVKHLSIKGYKHKHHARPTEHIRREHTRILASGKVISINSCVVNKGMKKTGYRIVDKGNNK